MNLRIFIMCLGLANLLENQAAGLYVLHMLQITERGPKGGSKQYGHFSLFQMLEIFDALTFKSGNFFKTS